MGGSPIVRDIVAQVAAWYHYVGVALEYWSLWAGSVRNIVGWKTGSAIADSDIELFTRIPHHVRSVFVVGNAFGFSVLALGLVFPGAWLDVIDAEIDEDTKNGTDLTRSLAQRHGLNLHLA